jgi:ABC-type transport system substrate-binding protein
MIDPSLSFTFFNLDDPVVGGYTPEKIALRRAIAMAYNIAEDVAVLRNGQAIPATQLVPPPIPGHDPNFAADIRHDPAAARALLDKFGYRDRAAATARCPTAGRSRWSRGRRPRWPIATRTSYGSAASTRWASASASSSRSGPSSTR